MNDWEKEGKKREGHIIVYSQPYNQLCLSDYQETNPAKPAGQEAYIRLQNSTTANYLSQNTGLIFLPGKP